MKKTLRSAFLTSFVFLFMPFAAAQALTDIGSSPYRNAIMNLVQRGVISGYADNTYRPLNSINRAEFMKIIIGALDVDLGGRGNCFPDVKAEWFAPYICYGKELGVVQGYPDGNFKPARNLNYVEALKILYEANGDHGSGTGSAWYEKYTQDAEVNEISIPGIALDKLVNRGEVAQLTWNYMMMKKGEQDTVGGTADSGTGGTGTDTGSSDTGTSGTAGTTDSGTAGTVTSAGTFGPKTCAALEPAGSYYVSPAGDDSTADGTINKPYKSINAALAAAGAGKTIILRGGTYKESEQVRVREPNVTIKSKNGEWAVIDFSGFYDDTAVYFDVDSDGSKLQCVEVIGGFYAFSTETRWDWGEADRTGASNILIEDSKLHASGRDVIKIKPNSDNITIRRNEIYDSGKADDPVDCNAEGIDNVNGDNMLVQNNYIHNICSNAVYCKGGATNCVVEHNKIVDAGGAGILLGFDTSPEFFDLTVNPGYFENIGGIARNNLVMNTVYSGIGLYAAKDAQVYNNTLINVATGDYHGAIYFGVTFQDWETYAGRPASVNPSIHHNVVSQPAAVTRPMVEIRFADDLGGLSALIGMPKMANNCYYIAGKSAGFADNRPGSLMESGGLADWQSHIGGDSGSLETNPMLGADFAVPAGNACAGRGYRP